MGRKTPARKGRESVKTATEVATVETESSASGTVRRSVTTTEVIARTLSTSNATDHSAYVYEEDVWEKSPKTDYTYSRTATYSLVHLNDAYVTPNMSRRRLHGSMVYSNEPCGDLLSSASSSTVSSLRITDQQVTADVSTAKKVETKVARMSRSAARADVDTSTTDLVRGESYSVTSQHQVAAKKLEYAGDPGLWKEKKLHGLYGLDQPDSDGESSSNHHMLHHAKSMTMLQTVTEWWRRVLTLISTVLTLVWSVATYPARIAVSSAAGLVGLLRSFSTSQRSGVELIDLSSEHDVYSQETAETVNLKENISGISQRSSRSSAASHIISTSLNAFHRSLTSVASTVSTALSILRWHFIPRNLVSSTYNKAVHIFSGFLFFGKWILGCCSALVTTPIYALSSATVSSFSTVKSVARVVVEMLQHADMYIYSITGSFRRKYGTGCLLLLFLIIPVLLVGVYYLFWCGPTTSSFSSLLPMASLSSHQPSDKDSTTGIPSIHDSSKPVAADKNSFSGSDSVAGVFENSKATVGMVPTACTCPSARETVSSVIGFGSRDEFEGWINSRMNGAFVGDLNSVRTDLVKLKSDIEGSTQQHVDLKLAALHDQIKEEIDVRRREMLDTIAGSIAQVQTAPVVTTATTVSDDEVSARYSELNGQYQELVKRFDELKAQLDSLSENVNRDSDTLKSNGHEVKLLGDRVQSDELYVQSMNDKIKGLQASVEQLQTDYSSLLQQSGSCCRTQSEMDAQIRNGIFNFLNTVMSSNDDDVTNASNVEQQSRAALVAWLGSQFTSQHDLEAKVNDLAKRVADEMNSKIASEVSVATAEAVDKYATKLDNEYQHRYREDEELRKQRDEEQQKQRDEEKRKQRDDLSNVNFGVSSSSDAAAAGIKQSDCHLCAGVVTQEQVAGMIHSALLTYDADKTGKVDFALESAGGSVINTRCSETYQPRTAQLSLLGIPLWYTTNSPRVTIQPGVHPGECWAFVGSQGYLVVQLSTSVAVSEVSIEHIPRELSTTGKLDSAPKDFTVLGLENEDDTTGENLGNFTYSLSDGPLQFFQVPPQITSSRAFRFIELRINSNHGNQLFTCLYRFRVHGKAVPPS